MSIDTAAILAARYSKNPAPLKAAVLGQGDTNINPYAALRALQLQKEAQRYEMAQAAMRGQQMQNQPSMVEQAISPAVPQMPPQMPPQGLPAMQQAQMQPQQPSPGLEGMPIPEGSDADYAGGGIVAFADEGLVVEGDDSGNDQLSMADLVELQDSNEAKQVSAGDPVSYQSIAARLPGLLQNIERSKYEPFTPQQYKDAFTQRRALLEEGTEPSPYGALKEQIAGLEAGREKDLGQARGMAMLAAAGDIMQPGGLMRGLGAAGKTFAGMYGQAMAADKAEKRALMSMQFNLADAQRKEKMGLNREAIAAADQARQDNTAAQRFGLMKNQAMATVASNMARATKPTGTSKTPSKYDSLVNGLFAELKEKNNALPPEQRVSDSVLMANAHRAAAPLLHQPPKLSDYQSAVASYIKKETEANNKLPEDQRKSPAVIEAEAHDKAAPLLIGKLDPKEVMDVRKQETKIEEKTQEATERNQKEQRRLEEERNRLERERLEKERRELDERIRANQEREGTDKQRIATEQGNKINEALAKWDRSREAIQAQRDGTYEEKRQAKIKALRAQYPDANLIRTSPQSDAGSGNKNSSLTGKDATIKGAPSGAKYGKQLPDGRYEVLDASGKLIGYAK